MLAARRPDRLEAVGQKIRAKGGNALAVPTDVTNLEQVSTLVEKLSTRHLRSNRCSRE